MIHARIDTVEDRKIVGFEVGTRAQFDSKYAQDPLWIFVDSYRVRYRADFSDFLLRPKTYEVTLLGDIIKTVDETTSPGGDIPDTPDGYQLLHGEDGALLLGEDTAHLYGSDDST